MTTLRGGGTADPDVLSERDEPFTVTVPTGEYPVLIARIRWQDEDWEENTAAMLPVLDEPTTGWELAVLPGQDIRLLGDEGFYGFGVDSGTGAFLDASGRESLAAAYRARTDRRDWSGDIVTVDPGTGGNLIAYQSGRGDGSYPVWIGRTADGDVTCLVADMLIAHDLAPLPPTAPDTAEFLTPAPDRDTGRPEPEPGDPETTAEFLEAMATAMAARTGRTFRS